MKIPIYIIFIFQISILSAQDSIIHPSQFIPSPELGKCYAFSIIPNEWATKTDTILVWNDEFPREEVEKYYDLIDTLLPRTSDYVKHEFLLAEYELYYDTIVIDTPNIYSIEGFQFDFNYMDLYYTIEPSQQIWYPKTNICSCCSTNDDFIVWCYGEQAAIKFKFAKMSVHTMEEKYTATFPKTLIIPRVKEKTPFIYKQTEKQPHVYLNYTFAIPKTKNAPKHFVKEIPFTFRYLTKSADVSVWREYVCPPKFEFPGQNSAFIMLELQHRLNELGYQIPMTNVGYYQLKTILKSIDIQTLENEKLIEFSKLFLE